MESARDTHVSEYTYTAKDTTPSIMVRKDAAGNIVKAESKREDYSVPPAGQFDLEITGFAEPFQMARAAEFGGGEQTMTRLEFLIHGPKGAGRKFTQMVGLSFGPKSKLGGIYGGARGKPIDKGEEIDMINMIGLRFSSFVAHDKNQSGAVKVDAEGKPLYASVVIDTIVPKAGATAGVSGSDDEIWN